MNGDGVEIEFDGIVLKVNLRGKRQPNGKLTALYPSRREVGRGILWTCLCRCGREREVPTKKFVAEEIRSCVDCRFYPTKVPAGTRAEWYSKEFVEEWRGIRDGFEGMQRLLFETILDGRRNWHHQMQAVDLVIRAGDLTEELAWYSKSRIRRAMNRIIQSRKE